MALECPNCREPISFFRTVRSSAWGRFRCKACGSVIGVDTTRRLLVQVPWMAAVALALGVGRVQRAGWLVAIIVLSLPFVAIFMFLEKLVVYERRRFCCRKCGYDLQGQTENRCPECGTEFDPDERERIEQRIREGPPARNMGYSVVAAIVIVLFSALLIGGLLLTRAPGVRKAAAPPPLPIAAPTASPASTP